MRVRFGLAVLMLCSLFTMTVLVAQERRMMQLDRATARPAPEIGAIFQKGETDQFLKVAFKLPGVEVKGITLEEGDVLLAVNKKPIRSLGDFDKEYSEAKVGAKIQFDVERGGKKLTFNFHKPKRPENAGGHTIIQRNN